jgi:hypothetical protein
MDFTQKNRKPLRQQECMDFETRQLLRSLVYDITQKVAQINELLNLEPYQDDEAVNNSQKFLVLPAHINPPIKVKGNGNGNGNGNGLRRQGSGRGVKPN